NRCEIIMLGFHPQNAVFYIMEITNIQRWQDARKHLQFRSFCRHKSLNQINKETNSQYTEDFSSGGNLSFFVVVREADNSEKIENKSNGNQDPQDNEKFSFQHKGLGNKVRFR